MTAREAKDRSRMQTLGKKALDTGRNRLLVAGAVFAAAYLVVAIRLIDVSTHGEFADATALNSDVAAPLPASRADIVDRNGELLATTLTVSSLYADPRQVLDIAEAADGVAAVLPHLEPADIAQKLRQPGRFVWIQRTLTPSQHHRINALGIPGLHFKTEQRRFYPQGSLTAHVVGFSDTDMVGLAGVEKRFDNEMNDGRTIQLSIDLRVQHVLHREIRRQMGAFNAVGGAGAILDVDTGEIIAMVSLPDFHPADASQAPAQARFNRVSLGVYEMGSTFKIFNTALALDNGSATLRSSYDATLPIKVGRFTINDYHAKKRLLSVPEVFMYSSNIGSAKMALDFGSSAQSAFMHDLGFDAQVPVELPERGLPLVPSPWRKINTMTIAFGHGIAVSPLHVASAVGTVVNGGVRWPVTVLKRDRTDDPMIGKRVLSERTAGQLRRLLRLVVTEGTGRKAAAKGYVVGGKTGTAEKPGRSGQYSRRSLLSSFVGAFPMHDPRYVVLVMIDEPKANKDSHGYATGGWVAAPAVKRIITHSATLLGVDPVDEDSPDIQHALHINVEQPRGPHRLASF